jgi:hypothetical protein
LIGLLIRLEEYPEVYFIGLGEYKPTGNTTSKGNMTNEIFINNDYMFWIIRTMYATFYN